MLHTNEKKCKGPRIKRLELTPVFMPFQEWVKELMCHGMGGLGMALQIEEAWLGGDFVVLRMITDDGNIGQGEVFLWAPETGISPGTLIAVVEESLAKYVIGESPFNVERIRYRLDKNFTHNEVAKGLLDMACYDLMGRISNRPAHDFMGGRVVDEVPLTGLVPLASPEEMVRVALKFHQMGMGTIRLKLGAGIEKDAAVCARIREALGSEVRLRVDYNQAYAPLEAARAIKAVEPFGITCAEQPVRADDFASLAFVQSRVDTPLMAHEGCFGLRDITTLLALNAVQVIGINGERPGGVTHALHAITLAEQRSMGVIIHNQPLGVQSAMLLHLASARFHALGHDIELLGHVALENDLLVHPIEYRGGTAVVPQGAGWGVEIDLHKLENYATSKTVVIE